MILRRSLAASVVLITVALAGCSREEQAPSQPPADAAKPPAATAGSMQSSAVKDALSATYASHAEGARVVDWNGKVLKKGTNGYTCMPTPPDFAARGVASPMCLDDVWMAWAKAWQDKAPFSTKRVGIAYMLAGDGGASNVDPYAEGPTDDNEWIVEGPHLMILSPDSALLADIPADPSSGGPYVMWRGTDYEHVMVPVKIPQADTIASPLDDALSAADTNMQASVGAMGWDGTTLKEGSSSYTCMPTPPDFTTGRAPMCFDPTWMSWGDAWQKRKPFAAGRIGISYMLAGDEGASNTDPYADGPTEDNDWVIEGPHMMLIAPDIETLDGITRDPNDGGPYVMWDGTDYAHVMIPVAERD